MNADSPREVAWAVRIDDVQTPTSLIRIAENNCALWSDRLITRERDGYVAVTAPRDEPNGTTRSYFLRSVLLHEEVRRTAERVVRVLHHSGRNLIGRVDLVLRPVVTVRLVVRRESIGTVTENSGHASATTSALRASVAWTGLAILALWASAVARRIRAIVLRVVALRSGVVSALIAEVVVLKPRGNVEIVMAVLGFECICVVAIARQMITMHELTVSWRGANDRSLPLPASGCGWYCW